jgi:hypothetical protein
MRSVYLTAGLLFIISVGSFAQDLIPRNYDETKGQAIIGGYFSFDSKLTSINGNNAGFSGGSFGIVIKQRTRIGLGGYSLGGKNLFEYSNSGENNEVYHLNNEIQYFGLTFEYVFLPDAPVHITIPVLLAGGSTTIKEEVPLNQLSFPGSNGIERTYWATVEKSNLSVFEPGINIELEMLSWMKLHLGASYRFVFNSELNSMPNSASNLSGSSLQIGIKFTCF